MQYENVKAITSKDKLLDSVRLEILNHLDFYCNFINSLDCVDELESYISNSSQRYDSDTNDLIIAALSNLLKCRILLLQEKSDVYALEHPHHCINPGREGNTPSFDFKFLWNGRDHYDSLIGFQTFCDTDTPGKQHVHVSQSTSTLTCPICENTFGTREM